MALPAAITSLNQASASENAPFILQNATDVAILAAGPLAWWTNSRGTMKGVTTAVPFRWNDLVSGTALSPALSGVNPIQGTDSNGNQFMSLGYGGSLAQKNFVLAQAQVHVQGTGFATGEHVTDGISTWAIPALASPGNVLTPVTIGTYSAYPSNPVALTAVSPSTGTGLTVDLDFVAPNGSLVAPAVSTLIPASGNMTFISAFRCPIPGGAAGATPGGLLLGNALNQSTFADISGNIRYTGLGVGYGTGGNAGKAVFRVAGDAKIVVPTASSDLRDDNYHVAVGTINPAAGLATIWVDGQQTGTLAIPTDTTINTTAGGRVLRFGAGGLVGSSPVFGFAGGGADQMLWGVDLNSDTSGLRQMVLNRIMSKLNIPGTAS